MTLTSTLKSNRLLAHFELNCNKCGEMNPDSSTYCQKCGADLRVAVAAGTPSSQGSSSGVSGKKASYTITSAFTDAIELIKNPSGFMTTNRDVDPTLKTLMINYVAVLAAVPFIATLIGDSWFYGLFLGGRGIGYAFGIAIVAYVLDIIAVFVVGFIIWKLAPNFGTTTNQVRATRMAAYTFTPAFLLAIFDIIPFLGIIAVLGLLYGLYILYLGLPILMSTPKDKVLSYVIVTVVATLIVYFVIRAIIAAIVASLFLAGLGLGLL